MNPLFYISGVADEYEKAKRFKNSEKRIGVLNMFTMFMVIAIIFGFYVFYKCFSVYTGSTFMGLMMGTLYALIIGFMDSGLFKIGLVGVVVRAIIILIASFGTAYVANIAFSSDQIMEIIEAEAEDGINPDFLKRMDRINLDYTEMIFDLDTRELEDIRKDPNNMEDIKEMYVKMRKNLEEVKETAVTSAKDKFKYKEPSFSINKILSTYDNKLPENEKVSVWYWFFFGFEIFPLLWKIGYSMGFSDSDLRISVQQKSRGGGGGGGTRASGTTT